MVRDERQRAVDALGLQEVGHPLPDENGLGVLVVACGSQDVTELLGVEIGGDERDIARHRIDDLVQPLHHHRLRLGLVNLEHPGALDPGDTKARVSKPAPSSTTWSSPSASRALR